MVRPESTIRRRDGLDWSYIPPRPIIKSLRERSAMSNPITRRSIRGPLAVLAVLVLGALGAMVALSPLVAAEPKVLYEKTSPFNRIAVTEDDEGLRVLSFEGVRQSAAKVGDPDHIEFPYLRAMPAGLAFVGEPRRVLIVGLGGGTLPTFLHKHYPRTTIDAVDIDPDVVEVAKRFFGFREDSTLRAHVQDGRRFIEQCRNPYDVIFLDAFNSDNIPYDLATREFLQAVRRALSPKGVVVANIWSSESNPLYDSMVRTYQDVFDDLYNFDVKGAGNKILVAMPWKQHVPREDLARRARQIGRQKQFRFDMGDVVVYGFRHEVEKNPRGQVLTDKGKPKKTMQDDNP
jgi:spermidine synthase